MSDGAVGDVEAGMGAGGDVAAQAANVEQVGRRARKAGTLAQLSIRARKRMPSAGDTQHAHAL